MNRLALVALVLVASAAAHAAVYSFTFDNGNLTSLQSGSVSLVAQNVGGVSYVDDTINGSVAKVAKLTNAVPNPFFSLPNPLGANGGGVRTNQYTVLLDVKFAAGGFQSLLQTGSDHTTGAPAGLNDNDGDWFVRNDGGLGISGDYTDTGNALRYDDGAWRRVVLTIDTAGTNTYRSFIDGSLQNVVQGPSGFGLDKRFSLNGLIGFFADEDGEVRPEWYVNNLAIWDRALTDNEVKSLGGATAGAVPEPATMAVLGLVALVAVRRKKAL